MSLPARLLNALAATCARRPVLVLALAGALGLGGAALALGLHPSAAENTFVARSNPDYRSTQRFYRAFGEEPIDIVVHSNLQKLLLGSDIDRLVGLEGCLSGNVPPAGLVHEGGPTGPCAQLGLLHSVKVVIGPGTFVNEAAEQISGALAAQSSAAEARARAARRTIEQAALAEGQSAALAHSLGAEASKATLEHFAQEVEVLGATYGLTGPPELNSPTFVAALVFDNAAPLPGTPKQRFAYLFPNRETALISVRMRAGLDQATRQRTIALVRHAVAMPQWHLQSGGHYLITGAPVIVEDLTNSITHSILLLLLAVLLVMALALSLVFRGRPRLLPLSIAALATALTFGALAAIGASLTVAQVAVLPVLVGLAVDYAIQFQSRVQEVGSEMPAEASRSGTGVLTVSRAAALGGPTIAAAAAAAAAALLGLLLSPVPTVRGFALLLAFGIVVAFLCAFTVGSAALSLRHRGAGPGAGAAAPAGGGGGTLATSWRGARELLHDNPLVRGLSAVALIHSVRHPTRVLAIGLALAALGWVLDSQTAVQTDLTKLVPQHTASLRNLNTLERASGVGGEIDLMVSATRVAQPAAGRRAGPLVSNQTLTSPTVISWMTTYENTLLHRFGYSATRGCGHALLCPAFSLPSLFQGGALGAVTAPSGTASGPSAPTGAATSGAASGNGSAASSQHKPGAASAGHATSPSVVTPTPGLTGPQIRALLRAIPSYFSQNVLTPDHRTATLAFGIRLMSLERQHHVIEAMRAALHPPRGVSVQLVGLPVLAAQSGAVIASPWRRVLMLLAGLAAAALVLFGAFRGDPRRALVPLLPVVLATGWSALVVFALRIPLNPMSVTLSVLVIAISTEFSVLLSERHREERLAGHSPLDALRRTYARTGAAVAASGVTAIMGFGVLVLSDIALLRDFGLVTLIDLTVSLLGVLIALPAVLLLADPATEGGGLRGLSRRRSARVTTPPVPARATTPPVPARATTPPVPARATTPLVPARPTTPLVPARPTTPPVPARARTRDEPA
jgi:predicted RND superfamily exporter protein